MRGLRAGMPRGKNSVQLHRVRFSAAGVSEVGHIAVIAPPPSDTWYHPGSFNDLLPWSMRRPSIGPFPRIHPPTQATRDWCHPTKRTLALLRSGLCDDVPLAARNSKLSSRTPRVARGTSTSKIACFLYERRWLPAFLPTKFHNRPLFPFCEVGGSPP